jgi:hypothetical protein
LDSGAKLLVELFNFKGGKKKSNMEIEKKCEPAKPYSLLSTLLFLFFIFLKFNYNIGKSSGYNIGIRESERERKNESQKLSK